MVVETEILPYFQWLLPSSNGVGFLLGALLLILLLIVAGFVFGLIVSAVRHGPTEGLNVAGRVLFDAALDDLPRFSFRRLFAIARLAVLEAIRRRVLIAFGVFVVVLLLAGLFLDVKNEAPARLYLSSVHFVSNILLMLLGLFLATFSLPNDIKSKTIYTVVTKPVRASEIVFGRIIGFTMVGTALLLVMAVSSYIFVVRGLTHTHTIAAEEFTDIPPATSGGKSPGKQARTSTNQYHSHKVVIPTGGKPRVEQSAGHWHSIDVSGEGADAVYTIGPPEGMLEARVPVYGKLQFLDRNGQPGVGINVGDEWEYRAYVEGGTASEAVWTFEGVTRERFPDGLPVEMNFQVFRTYKGNIERGVLGELTVRNPSPDARIRSSAPIPFESKEFVIDTRQIPSKLKPANRGAQGVDSKGEIDLFDDLVDDKGRVQIVLRCVEPAQYFGAAQADLYIRASDQPFFLNFAKGFLGIWLQMLLIISFGVMFSTFLSGPVAMLATLSALVLGFFGQFIREVNSGTIQGGGPLESIIRIVTQVNMQVDLEGNAVAIGIVKAIDFVMMQAMNAMTYLLPDYGKFSTADYVAYGYNIDFNLIAQHATMGLTYFLVISVIGYFCLKTREIAA